MKKPSPFALRTLAAVGLGASVLAAPLTVGAAPYVTPGLQTRLAPLTNDLQSAGFVIVAFNADSLTGLNGVTGLNTLLTTLGITPVHRLESLGMITANLTRGQVNALKLSPLVTTLSDNYRLRYALRQGRILCGVDKLRADAGLTSQNGGKVVDGSGVNPVAGSNKPQFSVVVIDSGTDTTGAPNPDGTISDDLAFDRVTSVAGGIPTTKIIQNVQVFGDSETAPPVGVPLFTENMENNDTVGHGSHCAGIVGATGSYSKKNAAVTGPNAAVTGPGIGTFEDFSGVASGVKIIGCGSGAGLFILSALGGFEYSLSNQVKYNVRITSNSYGSNGAFNPDDTLNKAIKTAWDRNITNVFAAGNSGPSVDTISNSSKSPYVINVAAGTKEGGLASFSSRGKPAAERIAGSVDEFNLPAITAPGTGREFEFNAPGGTSGKGFFTDVISTRSNIPGAAAGTNDQEVPAPYATAATVYTQISGTSMACPFIAGVCALLLDADSTLPPDSTHPTANGRKGLKEILQATATFMPGYADHEAGAGYVNAFAAVDLAFNPAKPYKAFTFANSDFNTTVTSAPQAPPANRPVDPADGATFPPAAQTTNPTGQETLVIRYAPQSQPATTYAGAKTKAKATNAQGQPNDNAYAFEVQVDPVTGKPPSSIDVRIQFGNNVATGQTGNSLGLLLWEPADADPATPDVTYSSGAALPVLDAPNRGVSVKNPKAGLWIAELRPVRGLAAVPITPPVGVGAPDMVNGQIFRTNSAIEQPTDVDNVVDEPAKPAIDFALANRYLDTFPDNTFRPSARVTRADFITALALNTPLRQSLGGSQRFVDVPVKLSRFAEAANQKGATLRDFDFSVAPTFPLAGSANLGPNTTVTRAQVAVAMVRALGLDTEARRLRNVVVTGTYLGQPVAVSDVPTFDPNEPTANTFNGYYQLALNRGLLPPRITTAGGAKLFADLNRPLDRRTLAVIINNYRRIFGVGNSLSADETPVENPPANP